MSEDIKNPPAKKLGYFARVQEAREYLKEQAKELIELQKSLILQAAAKGDFQPALLANQWLIEHLPAEDGVRAIDPSAAKVKEIESGPKGPQIAIGISLGGVNKQLPVATQIIDVDPEDVN